MNPYDENFALWRETLGKNTFAAWNAIHECAASPLRVCFESVASSRRWRWVTAAAIALASLSWLWNLQLHQELSRLRTDYAFATLNADSSPAQLTALETFRGGRLSAYAVVRLKTLVTTSRDPNVQIAALEILLDSDSLDAGDNGPALLNQVHHNRGFIEASLRARTTRI